jgi:chromosome partitioning protein
MNVITIINHKGGVGKTTTAINLGFALAKTDKRVLLIDLDPQANLTDSLGGGIGTGGSLGASIYGTLLDQYPLPIQKRYIDGDNKSIHFIPSELNLSGAESELQNTPAREFVLLDKLEAVKNDYDIIIIDAPPSLGLLTTNALIAATHVIIPVQAQYLALNGFSKILEFIELVKRPRLNPGLQILGALITQYDSRKVLNKQIAATLRQEYDGQVFKTVIRDNVALAEAPTQGRSIFEYDIRSNGAEDYQALGTEVYNLLYTQKTQ